jgi:hypothetical protein
MLKAMLTDTTLSVDVEPSPNEDVSQKMDISGLPKRGKQQQCQHSGGQLNLSPSYDSSGSSSCSKRVMNVCKNCEVTFFDIQCANGLSHEYCTKGEKKRDIYISYKYVMKLKSFSLFMLLLILDCEVSSMFAPHTKTSCTKETPLYKDQRINNVTPTSDYGFQTPVPSPNHTEAIPIMYCHSPILKRNESERSSQIAYPKKNTRRL